MTLKDWVRYYSRYCKQLVWYTTWCMELW